MAKIKATHQGECQICGHNQKLPSGVLSNHGYRVLCGFFEGVCFGANHLPFEQSCELVKDGIARAKEQKENIEKQIEEYSKPATEPIAWWRKHIPASWERKHSYYVWIKVDVFLDNGFATFLIDGKKHRYSLPVKRDVLEFATYLNSLKVKDLQQTVDQINNYITWQEKRIKDWQPKELKEV